MMMLMSTLVPRAGIEPARPLQTKQRILRLTHPLQTQRTCGFASVSNLCATFCATPFELEKLSFVEPF